MTTLKFQAPKSSIDPSFWNCLYEKKLNEYGLNCDEQSISAFYTLADPFKPTAFLVNKDSFNNSIYNPTSQIMYFLFF